MTYSYAKFFHLASIIILCLVIFSGTGGIFPKRRGWLGFFACGVIFWTGLSLVQSIGANYYTQLPSWAIVKLSLISLLLLVLFTVKMRWVKNSDLLAKCNFLLILLIVYASIAKPV
jgi:hypothetical protein